MLIITMKHQVLDKMKENRPRNSFECAKDEPKHSKPKQSMRKNSIDAKSHLLENQKYVTQSSKLCELCTS